MMRRLHLDFLHPEPPLALAGLLLLAAGIAATAGAGARYYMISSEVGALEQRISDAKRLARRDMPRLRPPVGDPKQLGEEVQRANAVLAQLTFPWDAMFKELEDASSDDVALLALQPEGNGRGLRVGGEAKRFEDLLAYIARLEARDGFSNVFLVSHEIKPAGAQKPVAFTLVADWAPGPDMGKRKGADGKPQSDGEEAESGGAAATDR